MICVKQLHDIERDRDASELLLDPECCSIIVNISDKIRRPAQVHNLIRLNLIFNTLDSWIKELQRMKPNKKTYAASCTALTKTQASWNNVANQMNQILKDGIPLLPMATPCIDHNWSIYFTTGKFFVEANVPFRERKLTDFLTGELIEDGYKVFRVSQKPEEQKDELVNKNNNVVHFGVSPNPCDQISLLEFFLEKSELREVRDATTKMIVIARETNGCAPINLQLVVKIKNPVSGDTICFPATNFLDIISNGKKKESIRGRQDICAVVRSKMRTLIARKIVNLAGGRDDLRVAQCCSEGLDNLIIMHIGPNTQHVMPCPGCLVPLCTKCGNQTHPGLQCNHHVDQASLALMKNIDIKTCPNCNEGIQKNDGCNHMTCRKCTIHFCWVCAYTFGRLAVVYEGNERWEDRMRRHWNETGHGDAY
jgi:hypothetical protein